MASFSVNDLKICSPCSVPWNAMVGDDRSRFCSQCEKHVYNIASLSRAEVIDLVQRTEGDFCCQLRRRRDGTVLTNDCPVGRGQAPKRWMRRLVAGAVIGVGLLTTGAMLRGSSRSPWEWPPTGPGVGVWDWWDWALTTVGLRPDPDLARGKRDHIPILDPIPGEFSVSPSSQP